MQTKGVSPSGPGCQPSASAAEETSSLSGIPNAIHRVAAMLVRQNAKGTTLTMWPTLSPETDDGR